MGVSFKVARAGRRYRPKVPESSGPVAAGVSEDDGEDAPEAAPGGEDVVLGKSEPEADSFESFSVEEHEASFSINLYADGFSIGKPAEGMLLPLIQDAPKVLHPYNRTAITLFSAIRNGWFPGDILDDIPCKYRNGTIICEVWDFRTFGSKMGDTGSLTDEFPLFQKVQLKMCMENVIKDIPSISNDSWTYNDLLQAESQIMKVLQPVLYLDPTPSLNRLCASPIPERIDLQIPQGRRKVKHQGDLVVDMKSSDLFYEGDVSRNEIFRSSDGSRPCAEQTVPGTKLNFHQHDVLSDGLKMTSKVNGEQEIISVPVAEIVTGSSTAFHSEKDHRASCLGMSSETLPGKRQSDDTQPSPKCLLKMQKIEQLESGSRKQVMSQMRTISELDLLQRSAHLLQKPEVDKMKHLCHGESKHSLPVTNEPVLNVISKTQPDMQFYVSGKDVSNNRILQSSEFQKCASDVGAKSAQHAIPGAMVHMQQNNFGKCTTGHDFQILCEQSCKQSIPTSVSVVSKTASSVSYPEGDLRVSSPGIPTSAALAGKRRRRSHKKAPSPLMKRPKPERTEWAPHQMHTLSECGPQQNSSLLQEQLEVAKMPHARNFQRTHSQLELGERLFEDVPKEQSDMHFYSDKRTIKCEDKAGTVLSENLCRTVIGKGREDHLRNPNCNVSKGFLLQANTTTFPANRDPDYSLNDSRPSMKVVEVLESLDNANAPVDAASFLIADLPVLPSPVTEVGHSVINRFSKIKILTERYALNCRKNKKGEDFGREAFSHSPQLLSELLKTLNTENTEGNRHVVNESCVSKDYLPGSRSTSKTRILTYTHSEILHREDGSLFTFFKPNRRLVCCESGAPGCEVEIFIIFEESQQPIHFAFLPNTHKAGMFVDQFTSLMEREGYKVEDSQFSPSASWTVTDARNVAADCYQVSQHPFKRSISGQMMNRFASMDRCISTANIQ